MGFKRKGQYIPTERSHPNTKTLKKTLGMYMNFQAEDPKWRLSDSQIENIKDYKKVIKKRACQQCQECGSKTKSNRACVRCRNHLAYNGNQ